jgi:serine/threonine protein kinase
MAGFPEIPGYKIKSKLGEGGVAAVYLGIQEKLDRRVAIKVLESHLFNNIETDARFEKEAKTAANLSHSNIIQIFDRGKHKNYHYIIMEYLEQSLKEQMTHYPQGKMPPETALDIIKDIFKALDYAHIKGIYHRDIKPENIMFKHDSTPVLVDFGIARVFDAPIPKTKSGQSLGTTHYMSPEQCEAKKKVDGRSDIYSLGAVLFEILTGKQPYDGETLIAIALKHIKEPVPKLPRELNQYQPLIDKMMAKVRRKRLSSRPEFLRLLKKISSKKTIKRPVKSPFKKYRDLLKEKTSPILKGLKESLWSLLKTVKKKLRPIMNKIKEKLKSFKNFLIHRKVPVWVLLLVMVVVALIILFKPGSKISSPPQSNQTTPTSNQPMISSFFNELLKEISEFYQNRLNLARELYEQSYEQGDLESSKKGQDLVKKLKEIAPTPEVNDLQEKFNKLVNQLEQKYNENLSKARKKFLENNFPEALESLLAAKQIKPSKELDMLEKDINKAIGNQEKIQEELNRIKDNQAYTQANSKNTIDAYLKYLNESPKGRHIKKAQWNIIKLKTAGIKKNKKLVNHQDMLLIIKQFDFFESGSNKAGTFKSNCQKTRRNGVPVIIDRTTGLMWYDEKPLKKLDFKETSKWIESLNTNKYGGYNNWRLPVLEEVGALLRRDKNNGIRLMAHAVNPQKIWTKDRFSANSIWVIDLISGQAIMRNKNNKIQVRPVRSME